jgi:hypothetical protein
MGVEGNMKYLYVVLIVFCSIVNLFPEETVQHEDEAQKKESTFGYDAGVSIIPFTYWKFYLTGSKDLTYTFDKTQSTNYETNFKLGFFSFGAAASVDNNIIGKLDTILGYVGVSSFALKVSESHIRGTGHWSKAMTADMQPRFKFNDKVQSFDLVYNIGEKTMGGIESLYFGITYTELTVPMEVKVNEQPASGYLLSGKPCYDEKFSLKSFGIVFGFDMLKDKQRNSGLDFFAVSQDRFNLVNNYSFSNAAVARARALNHGYTLKKTSGTEFYPFGSGYLDNETGIGLCWTCLFSGGYIVFAAGYDLVWGLIAGPSYEKVGTGTMRLEGDSKLFFRHGVIFRVYSSW